MSPTKKGIIGVVWVLGMVIIAINFPWSKMFNQTGKFNSVETAIRAFLFLLIVIGLIIIYIVGIEEGRRRYKGRPFESLFEPLEVGKEYKILSLKDGLRWSEEHAYLWLQVGDNKNNIIGCATNECWVTQRFKRGSSN